MKILITAADGFIGKNLIIALRARGHHDLLTFDADASVDQLDRYCAECGFVYHLAAANRPKQQDEYLHGDFNLTDTLLRLQRREYFRLATPIANPIKLSTTIRRADNSALQVSLSLLDISGGGVGLMVSTDQAKLLERGFDLFQATLGFHQ